ncbi:MAG: hypothetical protein A2W22_01165 [Candidatus Levybacteria bacterium RBG_16_35_11]|nr:MAG: hypothetical protein A2W22_01165 [Candidatus Levybacteria bacterium RBG_16_35_11]
MNRPVHFEIPTDDTSRAKAFYEKVFGWKIEKWGGGEQEYWLINTGSKEEPGIDGGLMKREKPVSSEGDSGYICTMDVENVQTCAKKVLEAGGKLVTDKMDVPNVGSMYHCNDTEGNKFGIMQMVENPLMQNPT